MKRLLSLLCILALTINAYSENTWRNGDGSDTVIGSTNLSDLDAATFQNMTDPTERLLSNYKRACRVEYLSAATLTVTAGEATLSNSDASVRLMKLNAADTTVTWTNIDTGAEANSTTYYIYGYNDTPATAGFSIAISVNSSTPSGKTNWRRLGSFYNNSSGDIEAITNDDDAVDADAVVKGWVNFTGTGTIAINDSYNVTSITDNATGDYTVTWDKDFTNANYAVSGMVLMTVSGVNGNMGISALATGSTRVRTYDHDHTFTDATTVCIMALGDQ